MAQRVSSDLWVAAYLRQCRLNGSFGYLARRGAADAGAIFIKIVLSDGTVSLYGPAPQTEFSGTSDGDQLSDQDSRTFELVLAATDDQIEMRLNSEKKFDPDIWIVEVENGTEDHQLRLAK